MKPNQLNLLPTLPSGGTEMIKGEIWHEIHSRFRLKESKKSIAKALDLDVRTVRKILTQPEPQKYHRPVKKKTLLSSYEEFIKKRLEAVGYCAQSIYEELRERGYSGGYDTVRRFIKPLRSTTLLINNARNFSLATSPGAARTSSSGGPWVGNRSPAPPVRPR